MGGHRNLEYAFWANEQTLGSAVVLFLGGLIGALPYNGFNGKPTQFGYFWAGIYSMAVSVFIILIEYPRGKRNKGNVMERRFQRPLGVLVTALGPLTRNYYSRFIFYFLAGIPSCALVTTILGGVGVVIGALIYLVAAIKGEEWRSPTAASGSRATNGPSNVKYISDAPKNPPPRRPVDPAINNTQ